MNFLFRTDVHVSDRSPESWKGDYPSEIWGCLGQIGDLARKHNVRAVLDGGDYFHVKAPSRNSHALVIKTSSIHAGYPCPTYCIEGNHDITYNSLDSIDRQPLGVLYSTGVFRHLREEVFEEDGLRVRVVGFPYSPTRSVDDFRAVKKQPGDHALIAIVHALASFDPPDHVEDFFGEPVFRYQDLVVENGIDAFCFGHWHRDQGIRRIGECWFLNQGAVSRGALVRENLERQPKVALLEVTSAGLSATAIPLNVLPAHEVFDLEKKDRRDKEGEVIHKFVASLHENIVVDTEASIDESIGTMNFAPEVQALAMTYLEQARGR